MLGRLLDRQAMARLAIALGLWIAPGCVSTARHAADEASQSGEPQSEVAEHPALQEEVLFEIVRLEYASAPELAGTLTRLANSAYSGSGTRIAVLADERTNSLLISGSAKQIRELEELVAELDVQSGRR